MELSTLKRPMLIMSIVFFLAVSILLMNFILLSRRVHQPYARPIRGLCISFFKPVNSNWCF